MGDHEDNEKRERVLLRPWLENLIESGSIPGLEWMDDSKAMFKVPWKHRSKKTWSLRHSSIFLEWAKNTGRWSEGDPEPNYAQLKTRLRCAFNKAPDIEEMRELHRTKAEEPYKAYKFIPRKESKLYPFGRRPLRKTTIPITVRRRHYFSSRTALTCRRFALSESSSIRIKEEKTAVSDISYNQGITQENINEAVVNQTWKNWVPDQSQRFDDSSRSAWPHFYEHEGKDEMNRILPLIVEEVNTNSMDDIESPMNKEVRSRLPSPTLPEISEDQIDFSVQSSVCTSFIGLPKFSRDDLMAKEGTRNQEVFSSSSLASRNLEHLHNWHQDSPVAFATGLFVAHPSNNSIIQNGTHSILPRVNGELDRSDSVILGSSSGGATVRQSHSGSGAKSELLGHSPKHFIPESRPSHLVQDPAATIRHRSSLVPAARLLPLKKLYIASQNAFDLEKSSIASHSVIHEKHIDDAVVKPNVIAQPPVAVTVPCDDISTRESGQQQLTTDYILGDASRDADLSELEVMDLSAKVLANEMQNSESRVLDLTKKMVVTPFQRDRHENMWRNEAKTYLPDMEKDVIDENLVSFDTDATVGELLKFNSEYKQKRQLIVTKMMLLLEKEKELKTREKQMAAREEVLFWKETYLHRVLSGLDYSRVMLNSRSGSMATFAPSYETNHGSVALMRPPEMKEASPKNLAPSALTLFAPQQSLVATPGCVSGNPIRQQQAGLSNFPGPDYLGNVSGFQFGSRDTKNNMFSSTATAASSYVIPHHVPVVAAQSAAYEDSKMITKASMLLSSDQLKFYRGSDLCFEPEADVALGDAYPMRRSYPLTVGKSQPEATPLLLTAANETAVKPVQVIRKRGRPKGSKNKVKLIRAVGSMSPQIREMPPLLGIQSSGSNVISTQSSQPFLPLHSVRNGSLSEVVTDCHEDVDSTATRWDKGCGIDAHVCRSQEMNRVLPPVSADSNLGFSLMVNSGKAGHALLTSESGTSSTLPVVHSSQLDHFPNEDIMPETVRQLLVSASKPVNAILPPLSPSKSPDELSSPELKVKFIHRHKERESSEADKAVTSVC